MTLTQSTSRSRTPALGHSRLLATVLVIAGAWLAHGAATAAASDGSPAKLPVGHTVKRVVVPAVTSPDARNVDVHLWYPADPADFGAAALAAAVFAVGANAGPPWGPETPPFNLEVILRDVTGGQGFGHVKFRQRNDDERIINLDTWVRDLQPNHDYLLQRAVDTSLDGNCTSTAWLTLGEGFEVTPITTDDRGTKRVAFFRNLDPPGPMTGPQPGTAFDIHFRVIDAATSAPVLQSDCYRFTVSL